MPLTLFHLPPSRKRVFLILSALFLLSDSGFAQSVNNLNQAAKSNSGRSQGNSGSSFGGSGNSGGGDLSDGCGTILEVFRLFVFIGQGIGELGKEEARLARRNQEENTLFCLETNVQAGYGFKDFVKIQPQARLHLGWASLDLRQTILNDRTTEFNTLEFMTWFNFINHSQFKLRTGIGALNLQSTGDSYFLYGAGMEILPSDKVRIELWGNLTQRFTNSEMRPRQEINLRCHYNFWQKGYARASLFGGVANQKYFQELNFTTLDAGVNFLLSFNKFRSKRD